MASKNQLAKRGPKTAPGRLAVSVKASTHRILSPKARGGGLRAAGGLEGPPARPYLELVLNKFETSDLSKLS